SFERFRAAVKGGTPSGAPGLYIFHDRVISNVPYFMEVWGSFPGREETPSSSREGAKMKMPRTIRSALLCAGVMITGLLVPQPASAINIVQNPGFESGSFLPFWIADGASDEPWTIQTAVSSNSNVGPNSGTFFAQTGCVGTQCIANDTHPTGA